MSKKYFFTSISGASKYLPKKIITNFDLEKLVDTNDDWIVERTGIKKRRVVSQNEATSDMCVNAINSLIKSKNISPKEIDAILVATITPDMLFPSTACIIQEKIGATNAWGYDLSSACSGFLFALESGSHLISSGKYKKVIVVGADTMSSILDYTDRNTCILFGDGAGAVLLEKSNNAFGIIDSKLRIDGSGVKFLHMKAGGSRLPTSQSTIDKRLHYVYQEGASVYKKAINGMVDVTKEIMLRNNLTYKDISLFIPHQANKRIIEATSKKLNFNNDQVMINIEKYANTTAATIPIALCEAIEQKRILKGDYIILTSYGAGFSWGSILIKWAN